MSESFTNPELRNANLRKIVTAGNPAAARAVFGEDNAPVGQITLLDGTIISDSSLQFDFSPDYGSISLNGGGPPIGQFRYYAEPAEGNALVLKIKIDTYRGEGSGIGTALTMLGDTAISSLSSSFHGYDALYAEAEDLSKHRGERSGWSSSIFKSLNFKNTSGKMFLKQLR
ncbi:MAG: hypothetical protein WA061_05815 [Microgenomates group bacterium]